MERAGRALDLCWAGLSRALPTGAPDGQPYAGPRLVTLWLWHSAEESEHRSTAFDLYKALGGDEAWRLKWFRRITFIFITDAMRQIVLNLRQDGTLWRWSTWKSAASFFFGKRGLARQTFKPWRDYLRADFHPAQHDDTRSRDWLQTNQMKFTPVKA